MTATSPNRQWVNSISIALGEFENQKSLIFSACHWQQHECGNTTTSFLYGNNSGCKVLKYFWVKNICQSTVTVQSLTHWGRVMHICISKITIIGPDNGSAPIWTNAGILLIQTLGTKFSEILNEIHTFSFKKMHLKCWLWNGDNSVSASDNVLTVYIHTYNGQKSTCNDLIHIITCPKYW